MKNFARLLLIPLFLTSLFVLNATAGTPAEDPNIAKIQQEFKDAPAVTLDVLRAGKKWGPCLIYTTKQGDFSVSKAEWPFSFEIYPNGVVTSDQYTNYGEPAIQYYEDNAFIQNGELTPELMAQYFFSGLTPPPFYTIKVTADGELIQERATGPNIDGIIAPAVGIYASSISAFAFEYQVCTPN